MRRIARISMVGFVLLLLDAPAARADGGGSPPTFASMIVNPAIAATILMNPHMAGVTSTAGQAAIYLRNGTITTYARFTILPTFHLFFGCDPTKTNQRFLFSASNETSLRNWVPPFDLESLFIPFGITLDLVSLPFTTPTPVITQISSAQCIQDPLNLTTSAGPGWLLMDVTIQFAVPAK